LIGEKEFEYLVDNVIAPILRGRDEDRYVEEVRQTMKESGNVPLRYLAQVWKLILENRGDVETGYKQMIKAEPTGVYEIVRHVMPQTRIGIDALTITEYLHKPSWKLLSYILSIG
jgi:hypothetical protein